MNDDLDDVRQLFGVARRARNFAPPANPIVLSDGQAMTKLRGDVVFERERRSFADQAKDRPRRRCDHRADDPGADGVEQARCLCLGIDPRPSIHPGRDEDRFACCQRTKRVHRIAAKIRQSAAAELRLPAKIVELALKRQTKSADAWRSVPNRPAAMSCSTCRNTA